MLLPLKDKIWQEGYVPHSHVSSNVRSWKFKVFKQWLKQDPSFRGNAPEIDINGSGDKIDGEEDNRNEEPGEEVKSSDVMSFLKVKKKEDEAQKYVRHTS